MKILLVDDESSFLTLTRHFLEEQGWQVITADNGEDALEKLATSAVDVIISDVYMPVMDGLKFHRAVRANPATATLPFLFVSAYDDTYTISAVSFGRNDAFVKKGRPAAELKEWVRYLTTPVERRGNPPVGSTPIIGDHSAPHTSPRNPRNARRGDGSTR
jgi:CheY-like chemotaxis protein